MQREVRKRGGAAPGRFVLASVVLHSATFAAFAMLATGGGGPRTQAVVETRWDPVPVELAPPPEPPPEAPPVPERPTDDACEDAPEDPGPLDATWEPATISVASRDGLALHRTPRAKLRSHVGRPGGTGGTSGGAAPAAVAAPAPPPAPEPPPVAAPELPSCAARVVSVVRPSYPESARSAGIEGAVLLEVDVAADGSIEDVRVVRSSGHAALDGAAVAAVRRWKFQPAVVEGRAEASTVRLRPIAFRLVD